MLLNERPGLANRVIGIPLRKPIPGFTCTHCKQELLAVIDVDGLYVGH
jgi:hypothetical protein